MPPSAYGGPWPDEWVSIFRRWIANGGRRLNLGRPDSSGYEVKKVIGGRIKIGAWVEAPGEGYRAWLDIEAVSATQREYRLVVEAPPNGSSCSPTELEVHDEFNRGAVEKLIVVDADGHHELNVR